MAKFQVPNPKQFPSSKLQPVYEAGALIGTWDLEFVWNLKLGAWSF